MKKRNSFWGFIAFSACLAGIAIRGNAAEPAVVVYGATPAGIAAAIAAGEGGQDVLLIEPTARIGGLVTSGLSHTDIRTFESMSGTFLEFTRRVAAYYETKYGKDSEQFKACERGIFGEPSVNLLVFEQMLSEQKLVQVWLSSHLDTVEAAEFASDAVGKKVIRSIKVVDRNGNRRSVRGQVFIDASYEGDLMAAAGVQWRAGREGRDEYQESLAPEVADDQLQAYNFRFIMTRDPKNRVTPVAPQGYDREDFLPVLDVLESGKIRKVFDYPSRCLFKAQEPALPNEKYDINDVSGGIVRLSLPGINLAWPDGDAEARAKIFQEHLRDQVGLLYFLQNDSAVPQKFQEEAREWGWCRDEFEDSAFLPPQLYVREARRMVGQYVFTERDTDHSTDDARAVLHEDAIAMGDYGPNCHGTFHEGPRFGGKHTGEFYKQVVPYQIPYGVLLPQDVTNLLVPGAVSSSHVGFCALRLESIWTSLGQAAGFAADQAIDSSDGMDVELSEVSIERLQATLHDAGSATIYVSDVLPGDKDFAAVQWWGLRGGWHGLAQMPEKPGQRGVNLHGQYFAAFPNHAAELDKVLDEKTLERWNAIAVKNELIAPAAEVGRTSRGEYLRAIWEQVAVE